LISAPDSGEKNLHRERLRAMVETDSREQLLVMLSDDRKRAIQSEAVSRARALSDELLRHETQRLTVEENDAPAGDWREELHIRCWAYAFEMGERRLKEK
jgi:hypothetical protein